MNSDKKEFVMPAKTVVQTEKCMQSILVESGGDFVLPDYMPKVQKVLRLEAQTTAPSRYVGAKEMQMSGSVLHTLIYLGEDGEVAATVLPSKYEFSIPFDNTATPPSIAAKAEVDSINYRMSGPRKLNIRTKLRAKPCVFVNEDITEELGSAKDRDSLNKLYGKAESISTQILNSGEVTVSDSVSVNSSENSHLIWCGSNAAVSDAKVTDGGISVRGEVVAKVLMEDEGTPKFYTKKIPFEEFIDGDVSRGAHTYCYANVISTEASKDGEEVLLDVSLALDATVDTPVTVSVLKDAFSENYEGRAEYKNLNIPEFVYSRSCIYNATASAPLTGVSLVLDTSGRAILDELSSEDGKLTAKGRCVLNSIYQSEDNGVSSSEFTVPFKIVTDSAMGENMSAAGNAALTNVRANINGDSIVFDMDIAICARVSDIKEVAVLSKLDFAAAKPYPKSEYPLCLIYSGEESLWSLAKKHHISPESLAKVNSLDISEEDFQNPEKLSLLRTLLLELK